MASITKTEQKWYRLLVLLIAASCLPIMAEARQPSSQQCASWQQQLENVQQRLRGGYRAQEGSRLREQRRELQSRLANCPRQRPR